MKLLYSQAFSAQSITFFLPKGSYGGFLISYRGINGSISKNRKDLGNINLTWNGNPLINVDAEFLSYLSDLKGGYSTFVSMSNAPNTLQANIYIPAGQFGDFSNAYLITDTDKVYFKLDFPNLSDISGTVFIYGIQKQGINNYYYCLTSRNVVVQGASTVSDVHRLPNVSSIFLKQNNNVTNVTIVRDNQTVIDGLIEDIHSLSDFINRVETSSSLIELPMNLSRDVREVISQEILFKYTFTGATTLEQYFGYNILTPSQAAKSLAYVEAELRKKVETGIIRSSEIPKPVTVRPNFSLE